MKVGVIVLVVVAVIALLVGGAYVNSRNQMVTKNETVKSAWAQVDVVLQRRADLIPNLVETVKGFAAQEQTVFHDISDGTPARWLLIVESYQHLKSTENSLRLQDELAGRETRIAVDRKRSNAAVQD